jgi:hypothetical protein
MSTEIVNYAEPLSSIISRNLPGADISSEAAATVFASVEKSLGSIEGSKLAVKLIRGAWADRLLAEARESGSLYGNRVIEQVNERLRLKGNYRVDDSTIYEERAVWKRIVMGVFQGDLERLDRWVADQIHERGKITWGALSSGPLLQHVSPAERYGSEENARKRDFYDAERFLEQAERIAQAAAHGDEEAIGVIEGLRQTAEVLPFDRPTTQRSDDHLAWIRRFPCPVSGSEPVDAAHFLSSGMGMKASDGACIPLARELHQEQHQIGIETFCEKYDLDRYRLIANYLHRKLFGTWLDMDLPT